MKKEIKYIFQETDHIDESQLWLYAHGNLSQKDAHKVERHLMDCPMCQDLVEGFSMYETEGNFNASVNRINDSFSLKKPRNTSVIWKRLAIAASVIILCGSGYFAYMQFNETNSFQADKIDNEFNQGYFEERQTYIYADTNDDYIALNNLESLDSIGVKGEPTAMPVDKLEDIKQAQKELSPRLKGNTNAKPQISNEILSDKTEEESLRKRNKALTLESPNEVKIVEDYEIEDDLEIILEDEEEIAYDSQLIINANSDTETLNYYHYDIKQEREKSKLSFDIDIDYFELGTKEYNQKGYKNAIVYLSKISLEDENYWDARWMIANSYLNLKDTTNAIKQFELLKEDKSPYKYSAEEKLRELK